MDASKLTVAELKVLAYDLLVQQANIQKNLQIIEAEINKKEKEVVKDDKKNNNI